MIVIICAALAGFLFPAVNFYAALTAFKFVTLET
jgi:hypothetical protein